MPESRLDRLRRALETRYEFLALVGRGAFASVYLARNLRLDRQEVLKVLSESRGDDASFQRRFASEARLVASLDHPNIVQVYDHGDEEGILWYSMQYVEGPTLRAEIESRNRFFPELAIGLCLPILDALEYSHRRGIVHRDIKPSNILLGKDRRIYLTDFGIAKVADSHLKTMTGSLIGTPAYIAPEHAQGEPLDGRADLYSLSIALYEMLAGSQPFKGANPLQIVVARLSEDPTPLSVYRPDLEPKLRREVMRGLARDREARFPDAGAMRTTLSNFLEGAPLAGFRRQASMPASQRLEPLGPLDPLPLRDPRGESVAMELQSTLSLGGGREGVFKAALMLLGLAALALSLILWWPTPNPEQSGEPDFERNEVPGSSSQRNGPLDSASTKEAGGSGPVGIEGPLEAGGGERAGDTPAPAEDSADPAGATEEVSPSEAASPEEGARGSAAVVKSLPPRSEETPAAPPPPPVRRPVVPPRLEATVAPILEAGREAKCAGIDLVLSLWISESGAVERVRPLTEAPEVCSAAAQAAARQYRFQPAEDVAGEPVAASTSISIRFGEVE